MTMMSRGLYWLAVVVMLTRINRYDTSKMMLTRDEVELLEKTLVNQLKSSETQYDNEPEFKGTKYLPREILKSELFIGPVSFNSLDYT